MPTGLAIASILMLFISFWVLNIARDPSVWRLWWMDLLGVLDVDSSRDERRTQERQMTFICYVIFMLLLVTSFSGAFWTFDLIREQKREKPRLEREINSANREIERVGNQTRQSKR